MTSRKPYLIFAAMIYLCLWVVTTQYACASGIVDDITAPFRDNSRIVSEHFLIAARSLFWKLAALQFAVMSLGLIFQKSDIQLWAASLIRQILSIGFYDYLMEHSYEFSWDIIQGFRSIGDGNAPLNPQNIFSVGHDIALNIIHHVSFSSLTLALVQGLSALIVCCSFSLIAASIIVALCEGYVLIGVGVLMTGLGGSQWTRDFAHKTLTMAFGVGIKLLTFFMLYQIGFQEMRHWTTYTFSTAKECLEIVGGTIIYLLLMLRLPLMAQQAINSSILGSTALAHMNQLGMHAQSGTGLVANASAAVTAGIKSASQSAKMENQPQSDPYRAAHQPQSTLGRMGQATKKSAVFAGRTVWGTLRASQKGVHDEIYGRLTGSKLKGGTAGGRMSHYINQRSEKELKEKRKNHQ